MPLLRIGEGNLEFDEGRSLLDVVMFLKENRDQAKQFGVSGQLDTTIAVEYNGVVRDLTYTVEDDGTLAFITTGSFEGTDILRHSASHIMAQAVKRLFPGTKLGIGPTIKEGFYYDMDVPAAITEDDLKRIEKEMEKIVQDNQPFIREEMSREDAIHYFKKLGEDYKVELLQEMTVDHVSIYKNDDFVDLCRGPHIPATRFLKAFHIMSVAGAYWRGSEKNKMLTRVYGTAFADKKQLKEYLNMLEEAKKRDHRKLGKELGLFSLHEEAPGLPFFLPKGVTLKNILLNFMREKIFALNYVEIETPTILRDDLWKVSGHMDNYQENMFFSQTREEENYALKPMNCPGGLLVYNEEKHSYRELPLKVAEFGKVHRFERSGQLHGLIRVRGFTQDDAHVFMTRDMIEEQVLEVIHLIDEVYSAFGFEYKLELSTKPEKAIGNEEMWELSTQSLKNALEKFGREYTINEGDGAFYGPKIDYHLKDAIGRTHQCGTIQLDMNLPERFQLNYIGPDGNDHRVVMIHRAIYGSLERFIAILIEHFAGKFPVWLAPVQVKILPVSDKFNEYGEKVLADLKKSGIRAEGDFTSEKLGYKIRKSTLEKVPYMLIVGEKEVDSGTVSVRNRDTDEQKTIKPVEFINLILEENSKRI